MQVKKQDNTVTKMIVFHVKPDQEVLESLESFRFGEMREGSILGLAWADW